jgi:cytoskeletal protein CcmA (bactofilin family)
MGDISMAWFDRNPGGKKESEAERPVVGEPRPVATAMSSEPAPAKEPLRPTESGLVAFLHKGSRVSGQLSFQGDVRIDGSIDGEIQCQGRLVIGEGAEVRAKISGQRVVIRGRVEGNVTAKEKIDLVAPARLNGNIVTPRLTVTEGVFFDGDCSMGVAKQKGGVADFQAATAEMAVVAQAPRLQADSEK